jgi:formylglycine-generating enzyme required for sulfatase activity
MLQLIALTTLLGVGPGPAGLLAADAAPRHPLHHAAMVRVPSGSYRPLYAMPGEELTHVASFSLDREPVTRGEFLAFVRANPSWRRSSVAPSLSDDGYLANWRGDLDAGDAVDLRRPVTAVSRYAASAYCAASGRRLPTVSEWEYAAAASETRADATTDPHFVRRLLDLYAQRPSDGRLPPIGSGFRNLYGVRDLHGGAWEWTDDGSTPASHAHDSVPNGAHDGTHEHMASCASAAIGATDQTNYPAFLRHAFRSALSSRSTVLTLGFRCAAA